MNKKRIQSSIKSVFILGVFAILHMFVLNKTAYAAPYDLPIFERTWGATGSATGQFNQPVGVAVAKSGEVFVADTSNNRVQVFDPIGTFISSFGSIGTAEGQFLFPQGLAIDHTNEWIYVVDNGNSRVQKFDFDGNFILSFRETTTTPGNGHWSNAYGVVVDQTNGNVYISSPGEARIDVHNSSGMYLFSTIEGGGILQAPRGMIISKEGLFVADQIGNEILVFNKDSGVYLRKFGGYGTGKGQLSGPRGIAIDNEGYLYVADRNNNRIQKLGQNGSYFGQWGAFGAGNGQFNGIYSLAISPEGNHFYTTETANNRIQKFTFKK